MSLIPKKIYQSWKTKNLPDKMKSIVNKTKQMNSEYEHELWDDKDCYDFLLEHFGQNYANTFDVLIPGAFKCDLWRYAILYIKGGIYMDLDMSCEYPFREILKPTDRFVSIVDMDGLFKPKCAIYQAFIACEPRHPIMLKSLEIAYYNIVTRRYDVFSSLSITGPVVVGIAMNLYWNKFSTFEKIKPGEYKDGIRLFEMDPKKTWDSEGKTLFINKFDGYTRGTGDYTLTSNYYKDDPGRSKRQIIKYVLCFVVLLSLILIILSYIFRKKWKECVKTCNMD